MSYDGWKKVVQALGDFRFGLNLGVLLLAASNAQLCRYRQFEELAAQKPRREKQNIEVLHFTAIGIETRDDLVAELLRFLLGIRRAFVDMQNVCVAIVLEA
jgi:hypothetical protein